MNIEEKYGCGCLLVLLVALIACAMFIIYSLLWSMALLEALVTCF